MRVQVHVEAEHVTPTNHPNNSVLRALLHEYMQVSGGCWLASRRGLDYLLASSTIVLDGRRAVVWPMIGADFSDRRSPRR
jgi:hypothetical protein